MIANLLIIFWFFRQTKSILFWLYFWQLKEYHIGRFLDHFRTYQGQRLLINKLLALKIILLAFLLILSRVGKTDYYLVLFNVFVLLLYTTESLKLLLDIFVRKLKRPVLTLKTGFLCLAVFSLELFYLFSLFHSERLVIWLLLFDVATPLAVSGIVLLFQPVTYFLRNRIIQRARLKIKKFNELLVIGITGSYGKTSTKEFLAAILSRRFKVAKTREHRNSEIGISLSVLNDLKQEHEIFVVEMGAYNKGGIKLLCDIVNPKIGILTGINQQHLATFGSLENIIAAKYELIESLPRDGTAFFNGNNAYCLKLYEKTEIAKKIIFFPSFCKGDIVIEEVRKDKRTVSFRAADKKGESAEFTVEMMGSHNLENFMLAISCAHHLGMSLWEIASASREIKSWQTGMKLVKGIGGLDIIDSMYSANPSGVMAHLEHLKLWSGKKIIIMPCLIELGNASSEMHREIGKKMGEICDLAIIVNRECVMEVRRGADGEAEKLIFSNNPQEITNRIKSLIGQDDVLLLEGRLPKKIISSLIGEKQG